MKSWPHAPARAWIGHGSYMITGGTYQRKRLFDTPAKLELLQDIAFEMCLKYQFELQAWAFLANHYHLVGHYTGQSDSFKQMMKALHGKSSIELNRLDREPGRKVWYQYWDSHITFERSYLARIAYVHRNPVKHGLVSVPQDYEFCSAAWFERTADRPWYETIMSFDTSEVNVFDDF